MTLTVAGDRYDTPPDTPRWWLDRLMGDGRLLFHLQFVAILARARWQIARGRYDRQAWVNTSGAVFRLIERSGGRFHITGFDRLRAQPGPVVLASNHMSSLENTVMPCLVEPFMPVTFVIKASLLRYPIFGPVIGSQQPIAVERTNPRADFQAVMAQGAALLVGGISVVLYPEGTRRDYFDPAEFNSLGAKLARQAGVPLIPVAVRTSFWGHGRRLRDLGPIDRTQPIHIAFGPAVDATRGREAHQEVVSFIGRRLAAWGVPRRETASGPAG